MATFTQIELVARRQTDREGGRADYLIYAGDRLVGRISCQVATPNAERWFWGVHGIITSEEIGRLQGLAESFEHARTRLRAAFECWLAWALAAPPTHLSYARIQQDLRDVGGPDSGASPRLH